MPRPRKEGPRWIGNSYYVQMYEGAKRHSLSLQTDNYEKACLRYAEGHKTLLERIRGQYRSTSTFSVDELRAEYQGNPETDAQELAARALGIKPKYDSSTGELLNQKAELLAEKIAGVLTWEDLANNSDKVNLRKQGKSKSKGWWNNFKYTIKHVPWLPAEVTPEKIRAWMDSEQERVDPRSGDTISPQTLQNRCNLLQGLLKVAITSGYAPQLDNPFLSVDFATQLNNAYLTPEEPEYRWMFDRLKTEPREVQVAMKILMFTGCRVGGLKFLLKTDEPGWLVLPEDEEGGKTVGRVPVPLDLWTAAHEIGRLPAAKKLNLLMAERGLAKFSAHSWRHGFKRVCREVGLEDNLSKALMTHKLPGMDSIYGNGYPDKPLIEGAEKVWKEIEPWMEEESNA